MEIAKSSIFTYLCGMKQLLSIVTICKDNRTGLERTIRSVIGQKTDDVEFVVIDGGSADGSADLLQKYSLYINIGISEPDGGIYEAMNKGIGRSSGEWLLFLNAGDILVQDAITRFRESVLTRTDLTIVYGDHYEDGKLIHARQPGFLKRHMPCCHQATFFRNNGFRFDTEFRLAGDYALLRDIWEREGDKTFLHIPYPIAEFDTTGFSSTHIVLQRAEYLKVYARYGKDLFYWAFWLLTKLRLPIRFHYIRRK